jgi:hypothetical protein
MKFFQSQPAWKDFWQTTFVWSFGVSLVLFGIEFWQPGSVTNFVHPGWSLLLTLVSGILTVFSDNHHKS